MAFLANHPEAGTVVPGSGGCRKVRWSLEGRGKSGAVRVIYTTQLTCGALVALLIYGKGATENIGTYSVQNSEGNEPCHSLKNS